MGALMNPDPPDLAFCRALPKVELHAHLSGSITRPCLARIWQARRDEDPDFSVEDPVTALSDTAGQSIDSFFGHFNRYLYHLLDTPSGLRVATQSVLEEFAEDGVVYLELRTTPRALPASKWHPGLSAGESIRLILSVITDWNERQTMRCNLILTIDRAKHSAAQAESIVDLARALRGERLPVVGIDLAGDCISPTDITRFRPAFRRAHAFSLPITVHFAEVSESSSSIELDELLSWEPSRLGHAIHVPEPMRRTIVERGIAVELCLTCNVLAGMLPTVAPTKPSFADHHFGWWHSSGASVSLGTDDVGVFGSPSSAEYRLAATHFGLTRAGLVRLVRSGLRGIFGSAEHANTVRSQLDSFEGRVA